MVDLDILIPYAALMFMVNDEARYCRMMLEMNEVDMLNLFSLIYHKL